MSTGLIVAGVVVFLLIDAFIVYRVIKRHKATDDFAEIPVPGETQVQLPAGKVKITYHEAHQSDSDEHRIHFSAPDDLKVEVTGGSGGGPLEISGSGVMGLGTSKSTGIGFSRDLIGTVSVTEPGIYTVSVSGSEQDPSLGAKVLIGK
jgi:hypothetical protein